MMTDLLRTKDKAKARLIDPRHHHYDRKIVEHLEEFLSVMRGKGKSEKDKDRKETILRKLVGELKSLTDITHKAIDADLAGIEGSAGNKKIHLSAISILVAWRLKKDRRNRVGILRCPGSTAMPNAVGVNTSDRIGNRVKEVSLRGAGPPTRE